MFHSLVESAITNGDIEYLTSYGDKTFYVRDISRAVGNLKREGVIPLVFASKIEEETETSLLWLEEKRHNKRIKNIEKYEQEHEKKIGKLKELLILYNRYQETMRERHLYDFNDMINFVLLKFREDQELKYHYAEKYHYIMLDEYQDTNNPQNEIIDIILSVQKDF
jgi:DNA helicase-2/ATP-dependent DNA helicase PcrA